METISMKKWHVELEKKCVIVYGIVNITLALAARLALIGGKILKRQHEPGVTVIAAIAAIIASAVALVEGSSFFSTFLAPWFMSPAEKPYHSDINRLTTMDWNVLVLAFYDGVGPPLMIVLAGVFLAFSVLLVIGARKNKSKFVKAFFVYGVILLSITVLFNLCYMVYFIAHHTVHLIEPHIGVAIFNIIFAIELVVSYRAFRKIEAGVENQFSHSRLQEVNVN